MLNSIFVGWLAPGLFSPSVGVVLCLLGSMPKRERGCYNNTEKPIFLVVVGRGGGRWLEALAM